MKGCGGMVVLVAFGLAAMAWPAEPVVTHETLQPSLLLVCSPAGETTVHLKLVVLNAGSDSAADAAVRVTFSAAAGAPPLELPPPGPRTVAVPLRTSGWAADHVELVELGEFSLAPPCPEALEVRGGAAGQPGRPLGRLRRGMNGEAAVFVRAYPEATASGRPDEPPADARKAGLVFVAVYEPLEDSGFHIRLACFNCGDRREADEDLFLHFELSPTGTDLAATTALGLPPDGRPTDSSGWHQGDLVVAQFGPYSIQESLPESVYLRAGLYNRQGDGARARVEGPDDTSRALLGRLVTRQGQTWFERAPVPCPRVPAGWEAAKGEGRP